MNIADKHRPNVEVILLGAGASNRMGGSDKLLGIIDGEPLLRRSAKAALRSDVDLVHVVLPPNNVDRRDALTGLRVNVVDAPSEVTGMGFSIGAGMTALSENCDAVIISLADMPDITTMHYDKLLSFFNPVAGNKICRAMSEDGKPGLPVLFDCNYFAALANLQGDRGARDIIQDAAEFVLDVKTIGQGAIVDLDTVEDWTKWHKERD